MGLQSSGDKSCTWDWMVIMSSSGESRGWQPLEEVKRWQQEWFDEPDTWEERLRIGCHPTNYGFCHAHYCRATSKWSQYWRFGYQNSAHNFCTHVQVWISLWNDNYGWATLHNTRQDSISNQSFSLTQMILEMYEHQCLAPHLGDICILVAPILEEYFVRYWWFIFKGI